MKSLITSFLLLLFINSCQKKSTQIEARITKVTPFYELKHYDLPHVAFSVLIKNRGNKAITVYVNDYGRAPLRNSGSFWVYYNDGTDSLKLFSASCEYCYEQTTLNPKDSLNLTLQIHYSDVAETIGIADSAELINSEIKEVFESWNVIKYFDNTHNLRLEARRQN
jgi:hypothetical protein